jgi:sulfate permease, SulP family
VGWDELLALLPGALAIAIIGYAETATVGESLADGHGYNIQPDRELTATGLANVLAGLFQGFITGGGASQSAANDRAGANTQLVSLLVSALTVLTAVALLPLFRDLPQAALAAIVISAVLGFLNLPALRRIRRLRRDSFALAMFTLLGVLLLAVAISILLLLVLRLDAPLLFSNAKLLRDRVREQLAAAETPVRIVLLDLQFTPALDVESLDVLSARRGELFQRGVALWLANARAEVQDLLRRSGLTEAVGEARIYRSLADAIPDARAALRS